MKNKKIISLLLTITLIITTVLTAFAAPVGYGEELIAAPTKTYERNLMMFQKITGRAAMLEKCRKEAY